MPKVNKLISYKKCQRCRHDRQKCLPEGRVWPGPDCDRCKYFKYACSKSCTKAEELLSLPTVESTTHAAPESTTLQNEVGSITPGASEPRAPQIGDGNTAQSSFLLPRDAPPHEVSLPALEMYESISKSDTECLQDYDDLFQLRELIDELDIDNGLGWWFIGQLDRDSDGPDVTDTLSARLQHAVALLKRRAIVSEADYMSHKNGKSKDHLFCDTSLRSAIRNDFEREQLDMSKVTMGHSQILASLYCKGQASIAMELQEKILHKYEKQDYRLSESTVSALLREYERFANRIRESWFNETWEWLGVAIFAIVLRVIKVGSTKLTRRTLSKFSSDTWKVDLTDSRVLEWSYFLGARYNARDVVLWVIERTHLKIDCTAGYYKRTALHTAALYGSTCVAEVLIQKGANLEVEDGRGGTPLHAACCHVNNATMVTLLMNSGANINHLNWYRETPLRDAVEHNNLKAGHILLSFGADVNAENHLHHTAITRALCKDELIALGWIRLLTKHGVNLDVTKMSGAGAHQFVQAAAKTPLIVLFQLLYPDDPTNTSTKLDIHTATLILEKIIRLDECDGKGQKVDVLIAFLERTNPEGNSTLHVSHQQATNGTLPRYSLP